jgi:hypothetical protein
MSSFLGVCRVLALASVIVLLQTGVGWAAETTVRGASGSMYAGAGKLTEPNNESGNDEYDVKRLGVGALGVWRPGRQQLREPNEESGFFAAFGGTFELEDSLHTVCSGYGSPCSSAGGSPRYLAQHVAARLGAGYSWRLFEFRIGALAALPDANVSYAQALLMPDVVVRIGQRSSGWFELGLGAYDASTNLRPGLYLGGALGSEERVRVSAHFGVHFVNGLCCSTVFSAGYRGELSASHAVTDKLSLGLGAAVMDGIWNQVDHFVAEGSARVSFAY